MCTVHVPDYKTNENLRILYVENMKQNKYTNTCFNKDTKFRRKISVFISAPKCFLLYPQIEIEKNKNYSSQIVTSCVTSINRFSYA